MTAGALLIIGCSLALIFQLMAVIDPIGAQGANDNDPFGVPPARTQIAAEILISVVVGSVGIWAFFIGRRRWTAR